MFEMRKKDTSKNFLLTVSASVIEYLKTKYGCDACISRQEVHTCTIKRKVGDLELPLDIALAVEYYCGVGDTVDAAPNFYYDLLPFLQLIVILLHRPNVHFSKEEKWDLVQEYFLTPGVMNEIKNSEMFKLLTHFLN